VSAELFERSQSSELSVSDLFDSNQSRLVNTAKNSCQNQKKPQLLRFHAPNLSPKLSQVACIFPSQLSSEILYSDLLAGIIGTRPKTDNGPISSTSSQKQSNPFILCHTPIYVYERWHLHIYVVLSYETYHTPIRT